MKSVRTWLFFVMPVFALMAMATTELRRSTNPSADWRDLAINGRGYIHTVDENGENPSWLRFVDWQSIRMAYSVQRWMAN